MVSRTLPNLLFCICACTCKIASAQVCVLIKNICIKFRRSTPKTIFFSVELVTLKSDEHEINFKEKYIENMVPLI